MQNNSPRRKLIAGEPLDGLSASMWNEIVKLIGKSKDGGLKWPKETSTEILVKNSTGSSLATSFKVVEVAEPVIGYAANPDEFFRRRNLKGTTPTTASKTIAIVSESLSAGALGSATLLGLTPCRVNVADITHDFAGPIASTAYLRSGVSGPARILWAETDDPGPRETGEQWALVLLTNAADPGAADCGPGCGWVAGLRFTDCVSGSIISASGRCVTDTDTAWVSEFTYDEASDTWIAADQLEISNVLYEVAFLRDFDPLGGDPQMTLTTGASGASLYHATLDCCGDCYAIFAIGVICTGTALCPVPTPGANIVRIRIECAVCGTGSGYNGPGYYCTTESAGGANGELEGPNHPDTGASVTGGAGSIAWTNPGNITATDTTNATCALLIGEKSHNLEGTDYDFTFTDTPTSLSVTIRRMKSGLGKITDVTVQLIVSGTPAGANKADTATSWPTSLTDKTYSWTEAELVTAGVTAATINATTFGVRLKVEATNDAATANVDSITVTASTAGCENSTCQYLDSDPGICEVGSTGYFAICNGPFQTSALCTAVCALDDDDGDGDPAPLPPVSAPCQGSSFTNATCSVSNTWGACVGMPTTLPYMVLTAVDLVAFHADDPDVATPFPIILTIGCYSGDSQYYSCAIPPAPICGSMAGFCPTRNESATSLTAWTIVYFNANPFVMVIDVRAAFAGDCTTTGQTTGGCRFTVAIP